MVGGLFGASHAMLEGLACKGKWKRDLHNFPRFRLLKARARKHPTNVVDSRPFP